jgi:Leucine-rich repeat (LRR) protein
MQIVEERIAAWIRSNDPSKDLILSGLNLTELPKIPWNCRRLMCDGNQLTVLPELPTCEMLWCYNNQLTVLPELPNCQTLSCTGNQLTVLPELPNCQALFCSNNKLIVLPELPNCQILCCRNNQLIVLPELHNNNQELYCHNNKYLWITKQQSRKYNIKETPNYSKFAKIIQRNYRRYMIRKHKLLDKYLLRDTIKVVCLYM